jgi:hypothetical protein
MNPKKELRRRLYNCGYTPQEVDILWNNAGIRRVSMNDNMIEVQAARPLVLKADANIIWLPAN